MKKKILPSFLLALIACPLAMAASPQRVDGKFLNDFKLNLITPHSEFAKPSATDAPKVLFIVPQALAAREVAELMQRIEIEVDVVATRSEVDFGMKEDGPPFESGVKGTWHKEKRAELVKKLAKPLDVIVLANFQYEKLPPALQEKIQERVKSGTGLLLVQQTGLPEAFKAKLAPVSASDTSWMRTGAPVECLPLLSGKWPKFPGSDAISSFTYGEGRVAIIDYKTKSETMWGGPSLTPSMTFTPDLPFFYEKILTFPAKALLWSAQKEPLQRFALAGGMLGCADGKLRIKVAGTGKPASDLKVRIADGFGRSYGEQTISVQGRDGESEIAIDLPPLPVGRFYADLWLKTGEKTQDWATVAFETGASRFADLALTSRALGADGEASGSFKLNKELGADEKIEVWLRDRNDRIVQKVPATVEGLKGTFAFKPRDMSSAVLRPQLVILRDGKLVDSLEKANPSLQFYLPDQDARKYHLNLWGANDNGMMMSIAFRELEKIGFDTCLGGESLPGQAQRAQFNQSLALFNYQFMLTNQKDVTTKRWIKGKTQFPFEVWRHPEDAKAFLDEIGDVSQRMLKTEGYRIRFFNLGDETRGPDRITGYSDWWRQPFQDYLKKTYGTVAALNESWKSNFNSFDEAAPAQFEEVLSASQYKDKKAGGDTLPGKAPERQEHPATYAPYIDHRIFVRNEYADMLGQFQDVVAKVDPKARIGMEGSGGVYPCWGLDAAAIARKAGFWAPYYSRTHNEIVRSFKSDNLLYGNWFGGYVMPEQAVPGTSSFMLWDMMLSGANMPCYFTLGTIEGGTNLDLSFAPHFPAKEFSLLASGVGECLASAKMQENPVAIHYSEASLEVMDCELGLGYPSNSHDSWCSVLTDLGIASHYIDRKEIEAGELNLDRFRVLILPNSVALSEKEVETIKAFVKKGGTVIADVRPGMFNEHGLYLAKGALDDLFGVTRQSTVSALRLEPFEVKLPAGETLSLSKTHVDPTVTLAAGKGVQLPDGVPVAIENSYGDGKAYLLNFNVHPHAMENADWRLNDQIMPYVKKDDGLLPLIRSYLERADVHPLVKVEALDGKALPPIRSNLFTCGDARLVTILESPTQSARGAKTPDFFTIITDKRHAKAAQDTSAVRVSMDDKWQVFDLVAKKPLGEVSTWEAPVKFGEAALYALYPKAPEAPVVKILSSPATAGTEAVVEIELKGANRDLVALQLTGPDGKVCDWFKPLLWTQDGKASCKVAFAWNDPPGSYTLAARRVLTGQTATTSFDLATNSLASETKTSK